MYACVAHCLLAVNKKFFEGEILYIDFCCSFICKFCTFANKNNYYGTDRKSTRNI